MYSYCFVEFFNQSLWYEAHDIFEELWHETSDPERRTLQGILQISVAQLHLERGNKNGAKILFGEGLGRLRKNGTPTLGLDITRLCLIVEERLKQLQLEGDPDQCSIPFLYEEI